MFKFNDPQNAAMQVGFKGKLRPLGQFDVVPMYKYPGVRIQLDPPGVALPVYYLHLSYADAVLLAEQILSVNPTAHTWRKS